MNMINIISTFYIVNTSFHYFIYRISTIVLPILIIVKIETKQILMSIKINKVTLIVHYKVYQRGMAKHVYFQEQQ